MTVDEQVAAEAAVVSAVLDYFEGWYVMVRSAVYREYVQLVRTPEGWKIVNTLWELT